jgi:starch synthase
MKVLFATAELAPVVRVGGLAEVASGLVKALRAAGHEVELVLPDYQPEALELTNERIEHLRVPSWVGWANVRRGIHPDVGPLTLIQAPDIARPGTYGDPDSGIPYHDNDRRFFHFSGAVAELIRLTSPDVVHLNDWHTAPVAAMFAAEDRPPMAISIHNLAYQGWCDIGWADVLHTDFQRAYVVNGSCVPLVGALATVDRIVAVSPTYAREILTPALGCGVHELLAQRSEDGALTGIRNGIDTADWSPVQDSALSATYSAKKLAGKEKCRVSLRAELGLDVASTGPTLAMITRLVDQKGVDLVAALAPYLVGMDAQLVVLGSGDAVLAAQLRAAAEALPGRVGFVRAYDAALSHRITAGSDLYLMPSRFEPCGLAQMQAMAYGTLPVVSDVGGLHDTVTDLDDDLDRGTGTRMRTNDLAGLVDAIHRAVRAWRDPARRHTAQHAGMTADWSWALPAAEYAALYKTMVDTHLAGVH